MDKQSQVKEWSQLYGHQITEEEYWQIRDNLCGFFTLLREWDKEARHTK